MAEMMGSGLEKPVVDMAVLQATAETAAGVQAAMTQLMSLAKGMGALRQQVQQAVSVATDAAAEVSILKEQVAAQITLGSSAARRLQKTVARRVRAVAVEKEDHQRHYANLYGGLKDFFDIPSYLDIPRARFDEAVKLIERYDGTTRHWWR